MSKKLYFGSNLKMYKNIKDTVEYLQKLVENTKDISREEIELFIIRLIPLLKVLRKMLTALM